MNQETLYDRQWGEGVGDDKSHNQWAKRDAFVLSQMEAIARRQDGLFVVELSVGDGALTRALLVGLPNIRLTCADISTKRLDHLSATLSLDGPHDSERLKLVACNFDTEFDKLLAGQFDVVLALDILEHVVDVFGFMAHCNRILKPGGTMLIRVPNIGYVKHRLRLLFGRIPVTSSWFETPGRLDAWRERHGWDGGHLHFFTVPVFCEVLESFGFSVKSRDDPGSRFATFRRAWPNLLFANVLVSAEKRG